jgi:hypothetical protein
MKVMIKHAAIRKDGIIYIGHRHPHCIRVMVECRVSKPVTKDAEQGFVTDEGVFVDRQEALKIAIENNQIITKHGAKDELYSEDLY